MTKPRRRCRLWRRRSHAAKMPPPGPTIERRPRGAKELYRGSRSSSTTHEMQHVRKPIPGAAADFNNRKMTPVHGPLCESLRPHRQQPRSLNASNQLILHIPPFRLPSLSSNCRGHQPPGPRLLHHAASPPSSPRTTAFTPRVEAGLTPSPQPGKQPHTTAKVGISAAGLPSLPPFLPVAMHQTAARSPT